MFLLEQQNKYNMYGSSFLENMYFNFILCRRIRFLGTTEPDLERVLVTCCIEVTIMNFQWHTMYFYKQYSSVFINMKQFVSLFFNCIQF